MGDMPDPKYGSKFDNTPVMNKIYDTIGRSSNQRGSLSNLGPNSENENGKPGAKRETLRRRIASMTLKKKSKITKVSELLDRIKHPDMTIKTRKQRSLWDCHETLLPIISKLIINSELYFHFSYLYWHFGHLYVCWQHCLYCWIWTC